MELKDFRYRDQFNVTGKLSQTLSTIISEKENVDRVLSILCPISQEYNGVLDATELKEKYPYLETFFDHLDTWRMTNNRATLEDSVIDEAAAKTLVPKEYKKQ